MISLICESEKLILIDTKSRMLVAKSLTIGKMRKDVGQGYKLSYKCWGSMYNVVTVVNNTVLYT